MKAIVYEEYGPPEVLRLKEVGVPTPKEDEVLVKVYAASVVDGDLSSVRGKPLAARVSSGLLKPNHTVPGVEVAGRVEAVGGNVKRFQAGDSVFGDLFESGFGAFAEYVCAREDDLALKPVNLTFEEAATVPQAALVALQALRDKGQIQPGQTVLINGASGGNGTFGVQIAKSFGAEVTGVCSTGNLELVRSIGADHVIDYTQEDFTKGEQRYDLILDNVANHSVSDCMRALSPRGIYAAIAFSPVAFILGPLISMAGRKTVGQFYHRPNVGDLVFMKGLLEAGKVVPVVDRRYPLSEVAEAFRYYGERHTRGKVVITVAQDNQ
jgi:NADPH:quinone reductase-like Zn-dependent oxidoreductase